MNIGKYRLEGGGICPEQYDVFLGETRVGYLRLRHGIFRADVGHPRNDDAHTVYTACPMGDGSFEEEERQGYLEEAINAIDNHLNNP